MMIRDLAIVVTCILGLGGCINSGLRPEATYVLEGISTSEGCLVSDARCLQSKFEIACSIRLPLVIETCLVWLEELESMPEPAHTEVKLAKAYTYYRLSEFSSLGVLQDQPARVEQFAQYRQNARDVYQEVYESNRDNTEAMLGLSVTSESDEERLKWKRKVVRIDPNPLNCRLLGNSLLQVYGYAERARWSNEVEECLAR